MKCHIHTALATCLMAAAAFACGYLAGRNPTAGSSGAVHSDPTSGGPSHRGGELSAIPRWSGSNGEARNRSLVPPASLAQMSFPAVTDGKLTVPFCEMFRLTGKQRATIETALMKSTEESRALDARTISRISENAEQIVFEIPPLADEVRRIRQQLRAAVSAELPPRAAMRFIESNGDVTGFACPEYTRRFVIDFNRHSNRETFAFTATTVIDDREFNSSRFGRLTEIPRAYQHLFTLVANHAKQD